VVHACEFPPEYLIGERNRVRCIDLKPINQEAGREVAMDKLEIFFFVLAMLGVGALSAMFSL
jgi:hypothetical protein